MSDPKKKTVELINYRFYENQKRQALTTSSTEEQSSEVETEGAAFNVELTDSFLKPTPAGVDGTIPSDKSDTASTQAAPVDKSRKGSVDTKIWNLVQLINDQKDSFFTTSSCSGRIILYAWETERGDHGDSSKGLKKGCRWLLVTHDEVQPEELVDAYHSDLKTEVFLKMEPCILHVQCRLLSDAKKLIHVATESGFRNSGMVIGKENRITVAIRSAMGMEVPLPANSGASIQHKIDPEYLRYLASVANSKMRENWTRSDKLTTLFSTTWKTIQDCNLRSLK